MSNIGNKRPFNHQEKLKLFSGGTVSIYDKELFGTFEDGNYIDSRNARSTSDDGSHGALESISGEELLYDQNQEEGSYYCVKAVSSKGRIIEFWADTEETEDPLIRIDGRLVLKSYRFNINHKTDLCVDVNENIEDGEVFVTSKEMTPIIFSVKDLLANVDNERYFSEFNPKLYEINLRFPINVLKFDSLVNVGSGGGLPSGQYSYQYRYVSVNGDRTAWSISTPLIPIPKKYVTENENETIYPYIDTHGSEPNPEIANPYGIKLKLRINNIYNHDYIELLRIGYNSGEGLDFRVPAYVVQRIQISPGQFSIIDIVDSVSNETDRIPVPEEVRQNVLSIIKNAGRLKYFKNRLVLADVEYEKRDIEDSDIKFLESPNGNVMYPILKMLGSKGYNDAKNHAYYKSLMHDEKYGWAILMWDENFQRSFVKKIDGYEDYQMPTKREPQSDDTIAESENLQGVFQRCQEKSDINGEVSLTYEVVHTGLDLSTTIFSGLKSGENGNEVQINIGNVESTNERVGDLNSDEVGYKPWRPTRSGASTNNRHITPTAKVEVESGFVDQHDIEIYTGAAYMSLGMCLHGLSSLPSWAKAFSIVRTKRANRVIAQGIGVYDIVNGTIDEDFNSTSDVKKSLNRIAVHFTDFESGLVDPNKINDIINNPSNYKIQLVEPLGIQSEIYGSATQPSNTRLATMVDMVTYVNVQKQCRPNGVVDGSFGIGEDEDVAYGKYLNTNMPTAFPSNGNGNQLIGIENVFIDTKNEEGAHVIIFELDRNIYANEEIAKNYDNRFPTVLKSQNFLEPFYVVSLIEEGASIQDKSFTEYIINGSYIKVESVVGYGTSEDIQEFDIVDERSEDFHRKNSNDIYDNFVYVKEEFSDQERVFVNINYFTPAEITQAVNDINNETTDLLGIRIHGLYTSSENKIVFNSLYHPNVPQEGDIITVKYNNKRPIKIFSGDTFVGENIFPYAHRLSSNLGMRDGTVAGDTQYNPIKYKGTCLILATAFPHYSYIFNKGIFKLRIGANDGGDRIHLTYRAFPDIIRQLIYRYSCSTRTNTAMAYGEFFPLVNYVERPITWTPGFDSGNQTVVVPEYFLDFPNEDLKWRLGGFRVFPSHNLDYSKEAMHELGFSKPEFSYEKFSQFKNRIAWSNARPIQIPNAPSLKSFKPFDYIDISDKYGNIKELFVARGQNGDNLYAFTDEDVCLVLVNKRVLLDSTGNILGTSKDDSSNFLSEEIWLGLKGSSVLEDRFYLSYQENGNQVFFCNREGVFMFENASLVNIDTQYRNTLFHEFLNKIVFSDENKDITTVYDSRYGEYWIQYKSYPVEIYGGKVYIKNPFHPGSEFFAKEFVFGRYSDDTVFIFTNTKEPEILEPYESDTDYSFVNRVGLEFYSDRDGIWYIYNKSKIVPDTIVSENWLSSLFTKTSIDLAVRTVKTGYQGIVIFDHTTEVTINSLVNCSLFSTTGPCDEARVSLFIQRTDSIINELVWQKTVYINGSPTPSNLSRIDIISVNRGDSLFISLEAYIPDPGDSYSFSFNPNLVSIDYGYTISGLSQSSLNIYNQRNLVVECLPETAYKLTYNKSEDELLSEVVNINSLPSFNELYVYCNDGENSKWQGRFDYRFDKYLSFDGRTFGFRNLRTYELHKGGKINSQDISFEVFGSLNIKELPHSDKEFVSVQVNTNRRPDSVKFYETYGAAVFSLLQGIDLKDYGGYWNWIPRGGTKRLQGTHAIFSVSYVGEFKFVIRSLSFQFKILK